MNTNKNIASIFLTNVFNSVGSISQKGDVAISHLNKDLFFNPAFIVPLFSLLNPNERILLKNHVPNLLEVEKLRLTTFKALIQEFSIKNYLPLILFPTDVDETQISNTISAIETIIEQQIGKYPNVLHGLRYIIGECIDNIIQHSKSKAGLFCSKIDNLTKTLDIAIADDGITLLGSYRANEAEIIDDLEAMMAANRGISTKNLPNAENRGYGIITSKRMSSEGLNGYFIMISGGAMMAHSGAVNEFLNLPDGLKCHGTVILYRISLDSPDFNYINFVE